jgi:RNA polymerase sigma factor (sigma-70 family)
MENQQTNGSSPGFGTVTVLYHFCRLQLPMVVLPTTRFERHLERTYTLFQAKRQRKGSSVTWPAYLENLHAVDWFLCCGCLEGEKRAWECLFASRASRADRLLVDALRAKAIRFFPGDEERQETAVQEFWGYIFAGEKEGSTPILQRYDGQRPLVPWLIMVFKNRQISRWFRPPNVQPIRDEDLDDEDLPFPHGDSESDQRWHEAFRAAAAEWLAQLDDAEVLIIGLRLRHRLDQREVAKVLGVHEGNVSRKTTKLGKDYEQFISARLVEQGWLGDDLRSFVLKEMQSLVMDEPRFSEDRLAALLAARGKTPPDS